MGHSCHNSTVTDEEQKVLKVRGLRVSDVSLSPKVDSTNGLGLDALFAERLGDVLRHRWSKHYSSAYQKKKVAINVVEVLVAEEAFFLLENLMVELHSTKGYREAERLWNVRSEFYPTNGEFFGRK
ncbi:hypothetical protein HHI36_021808 [Cryptolaemus montrouzieri]|uniref:Uncharacterized protein n=1 Tax=Cryptolaemus montrouzieri TaxID=559131 RepID=A0ABD2MXU1_9CUCU